jgi:colanic acid biosynthesis glycosyl transferase WcaI
VELYIHDYTGHVGQVEIARALAQHGHSVTFTFCEGLATPRGDVDAHVAGLTAEAIGIGASINKKNYFRRQWQDLLYARALVKNLARYRPQVVLSANTPLVPEWALVRYCRRRGIPVIHWWTDVYSSAVRHGVGEKFGPLGRLIAWCYEKLEIRILQRSQAILAIAPQFQDIADRWKVPTPFTVIPVAAPTEQIRPGSKRNPWSERHGIADTVNVIYSGTLGIKHHPELLYEIAQGLLDRPDCRVIVVAEGVGADVLRRMQEENRLANLMLLPFQAFEDYGHVLAAADVQVTTLNIEASAYALPSKVMSQLCSQRAQAVFVPEANYVGRLVSDAKAGVVASPLDVLNAQQIIRKLLDDSELRGRYAANARRYAEDRLSVAALLPDYEALLMKIAPVQT